MSIFGDTRYTPMRCKRYSHAALAVRQAARASTRHHAGQQQQNQTSAHHMRHPTRHPAIPLRHLAIPTRGLLTRRPISPPRRHLLLVGR